MMDVAHLTCLWPGLTRLWRRGDLRGLVTACAFGMGLNALIVTSLVWQEFVPGLVRGVGAAALALWWIAAAVVARKQVLQPVDEVGDRRQKGLFTTAQREYLKGNWIDAEAAIRKLLRYAPDHCEALLLMATLLRRTGRLDAARLQLQRLSRLEGAGNWELELRTQRELLRRQSHLQRTNSPDETATPSEPEQSPNLTTVSFTQQIDDGAASKALRGRPKAA